MAASFPVNHFNIPRTHLLFHYERFVNNDRYFTSCLCLSSIKKYFRSRWKGYIFNFFFKFIVSPCIL